MYTRTARRFTLTESRPGPVACRQEETLSNGWSTTDLLLESAAQALLRTCDQGFTLAELEDEVRGIMRDSGILFLGHTSRPEKYKDDAQRVVWSRFGDLHRAGIFAEAGGVA